VGVTSVGGVDGLLEYVDARRGGIGTGGEDVKEKTDDLRNSSCVVAVRHGGRASFAHSIRSGAIGMTRQGTPNPRGRGKRRPYKRGSNPRGRGEPLPPTKGYGLIVDVGFGFELGEHRLEEGFVGVGSAGDGQLHFL